MVSNYPSIYIRSDRNSDAIAIAASFFCLLERLPSFIYFFLVLRLCLTYCLVFAAMSR